MNVYFFSGLGADSSIFRHIRLPQGYDPIYIDWIPPLPNESLSSYALRLAKEIDTSQPFSLIGLSMGGMIAVEIASHYQPVRLVLISSIPSSGHLPPYYRALAGIGLHKILPISLFLKGAVLKRFFSTETIEDKKLIKHMIRKADPSFIRWGMEAIVGWETKNIPENLVHIHGSRDEILPRRYTRPTYTIPEGGHLMILTRAKEINELLVKLFT